MLFSCNINNDKLSNKSLIFVKEGKEEEKTTTDCLKTSYERFNEIKLNGIIVSRFNINKFIKRNKKPDSIKDEYYFYGKSSFMFDSERKEIITIEINDDNLYLDDLFSIKTNYSDIIKKYPCSFKNRSKTEYRSIKVEAINLYDEEYNNIKIFVDSNQVLGIIYIINESDYDKMNEF